jgi:hypothetical protein
MSVATDIRSRAEDVLGHSKQALAQAQTRLKSDERFTTIVGRVESAYGTASDAVSGHVIKPAKELIAKSPLAGKFGSAPAPLDSEDLPPVAQLKKPAARKTSTPVADGDDSIKE